MNMNQLLPLVVAISLFPNVLTINVLAIISLPLKSHYMAFHPLFRELANRGHNVTVVNNFPQNDSPAVKFVDLGAYMSQSAKFPDLSFYEEFGNYRMRLFNFFRHITVPSSPNEMDCRKLLTTDEVTSLRSEKFDVIFVEQFMSDCALVYAARFFDAPIIGITSHVLLPFAYSRLGIPFNAATDPFYFSDTGVDISLYSKLESYLMHWLFTTVGRWHIQRNIYKVFGEHLPEYELDIEEVARERMRMVFAYQHPALTGARLGSPQLLDIGGMHVGRPGAVPEDVEEFLRTAHHGAVYVSFGSNLRANTMTSAKVAEFLRAVQLLAPVKVLWKWEGEGFGVPNLMTKSWFPQLDVLCHPRVKAFVSHGGMLSLSEAARCAVPAVAVPFFGDQFGNAALAAAMLHFDQLTGDSLASVLRKLMAPETQERTKENSQLWNDRPMSALDSAIYWTEYVTRHRGAPPPLPAKQTGWFHTQLIDVYSIALLFFLFLLWTINKLTVIVIRCFFTKKKTKSD